jgi:tRNA U34 5-carboxymethylaminomethyl modifying GTPase MnmE/TrmE
MYTINPKDPIIAIASAPGTGAIAVIRISGTGCIGIVSPLFKSLKKKSLSLSDVKSHSLHFGVIEDEGRILDEVLVSVFKGPHSYTGDDKSKFPAMVRHLFNSRFFLHFSKKEYAWPKPENSLCAHF